MVQTIIDMAKNFRIDVIAEGVETEEQLQFLKRKGCMAYQGYLFGKPVPIDEFEMQVGKSGTTPVAHTVAHTFPVGKTGVSKAGLMAT